MNRSLNTHRLCCCLWSSCFAALTLAGCGEPSGGPAPDLQVSIDASAPSDGASDGGPDMAHVPVTRYVSATGADSGDCPQASPCLSLQYATSRSLAGDTVLVNAGNYGPQQIAGVSGAFGLPVTVRALGKVTLARALPLTADSEGKPLLSITNCAWLTVSGFKLTGAAGQMGYLAAPAPDGEILATKTDMNFSAAGLVIDAMTIDQAAGTCIAAVGLNGVKVSNSTITNCGVLPVGDGGVPALASGRCVLLASDDSLAQANVLSHCSVGVDAPGLRARVAANTISYCDDTGINTAPQAQINANTVHHCRGYGIHADASSIIQQNVVALNGLAGGSPAGMAIALPSNDVIENNTLYKNGGHEILGIVQGSAASAPITIENNIFYHATPGDVILGAQPAGNSVIDYNLYFNVSGVIAGAGGDGGVLDFSGAHSIKQMDPLFVDEGAMPLPDLHLQQGSPAREVGTNVGLPFNGKAPNIGAL